MNSLSVTQRYSLSESEALRDRARPALKTLTLEKAAILISKGRRAFQNGQHEGRCKIPNDLEVTPTANQ